MPRAEVAKRRLILAAGTKAPSQETMIIGLAERGDQILRYRGRSVQRFLNQADESSDGFLAAGSQGLAAVQVQHLDGFGTLL